ncbi:hypothetical protein [Aporhodopirellula aestuarii]|uniref:Uncharacterized protein n=1 Tax=Aporhodopirellula aestuarii TaxID=2950107 RepID=A0ABT0UF15_9BACT|nr:hypothetical protein [Aporhodopirellula aestuarii]MCM2374980.1 hypothetical protein [Aporhodopirellula aestuarii]
MKFPCTSVRCASLACVVWISLMAGLAAVGEENSDHTSNVNFPLLNPIVESWPVDPAMSRDQEREIWVKLFRSYHPRQSEIPLNRWVAEVTHQCPMEIDRVAFETIGLTEDTPITFPPHAPPRPLVVHAMRMLQTLESVIEIRNGAVLITTAERAAESLAVRIYDVTEIVHLGDETSSRLATERLIKTIEYTIDPESWESLGGTGIILSQRAHQKHLLCIAAPTQIHWKAQILLDQLHSIGNGSQGTDIGNRHSHRRGGSSLYSSRLPKMNELPRFQP